MPIIMKIEKATAKNKKWKAIFSHMVDGKMKIIKTTSFGSSGMDDYTISKDKSQRSKYIARHNPKKTKENWKDYMSAGALSRFILWGDSTNINTNIKSYKKMFKLK
tara:strand:- start:1857 stop:2174 length:318 start_codon:yes stop_codon:yes gene_type:complete